MSQEEDNNYTCNNCNFKCNSKARWNAHIKTELHTTGTKKRRSDYKEPYKCDSCDYETKNVTMIKVHKLNKHSTKETREKEFTYYCGCCNFGSFSKDSYALHVESIKHKYYDSIK